MRFNTLILSSVFAVMLLGSEASVAQSTQYQRNVLKPRSTSPFEIARVIKIASSSWKKHRVEVNVDLTSTWKQLALDPGDFNDCAYCEAAIFKSELDGQPGPEVILKITRSFDFVRYLIFSQQGHRYNRKLIGHIDHDFNRYQLSSHRIASANGNHYLVIRGQEGSGSGFALYAETWYRVNRHGMSLF